MTFEEIMIHEDEADMFLLDEFDNDDTEDISLVENLETKIKVEPMPKDTTVPAGWRYKRKSKKIVSPNGEVFRSRRGALKAMVNSENYSMEEIEEMRYMLRHERWRESDDLPRCWMIRDGRRKHGSEFLGPGGEFFVSLKKVSQFICNYEEYFYTEDLEQFWEYARKAGLKKEDINIEGKQAGSNNYASRNQDKEKEPGCKVDNVQNVSPDGLKGWKSADSKLPKGWMSKESCNSGVKLLMFKTPEGKVLSGRGLRSVLKFMIQNDFPMDQIQKIKSSLTSEGWKEFDLLSSQWMYKLHEKKERKNLFFLDSDANLYRSKEEVKRHLNQLKDFKSLSKFDEFLQSRPQGSYYKAGQELTAEWVLGDCSVPTGWRIRKRFIGGSVPGTQLLTPDNKCLDGRRSALKFMVSNNYPKEEIQLMRNGLMTHGKWLHNPRLPENWLYKCSKTGIKSNFIDPEGNYYKSQLEVLKYLKKKNNQQVLNVFKSYFKSPPVHKVDNEEGWRENDPTVPSGWAIKDRKDGHCSQLLSPEGYLFVGKKAALRHLIENNYPEKQVQEMRHSLSHEGWSVSDSLPCNWLYKISTNGEFLSQDATHYKSTSAAIRDLEENNFTAEKEMLEKFCQKLQRNERIEDESWTEDESSAPLGWKTKEYKIGNRTTVKKFISPDGHIFTKRTSALKFMFDHKESFSNHEVNQMKVLLQKHEQWYTDPQLPKGWLYKKSKNGLSFLSRQAEFLKSREAALKHLEDKNNLKERTLLQGFISCDKRNDRIEDNTWNLSDQTVPPGWKTKQKQNGSKSCVLVLISPDGQLCMGRRKALKYMIENKNLFSGSEVDEMKSLLQLHDGWLSDNKLPRDWLYKRERNARFAFLDPFGNYYRSKEQLFATLTKDILDGLRGFLDSKGISCLGQDAWISNDPWLPPGWKIRKLELEAPVSERVRALLSQDKIASPDGHIFQGKAHAMKHMIREKYSGEDITIMRNGLLAEGWFEDPVLPKNWLAKRNSNLNHCRFMDEKGNLFRSSVIAIQFLRKEGRPEDMNKLKTYYASRKRLNRQKKLQTKEIETNHWKKFEEESLSGWKRKIDDSGQEQFMSPSGDYFRGRFRLIKYIKNKDINEKSIATLIEILGFDKEIEQFGNNQIIKQSEKTDEKIINDNNSFGSIESQVSRRVQPKKVGWFRFKDEALAGWKYRTDEETHGPRRYKNPSGEIFIGRSNVLKYMKENNLQENAISAMKKRFRQEDEKEDKSVKKREMKGKSKAVVKSEPTDPTYDKTFGSKRGGRRQPPSGWKTFDDESLAGWKYKSEKSGHCRYLSPDGDYLNGRLQVLKFMKENKVGEDSISAMRKSFRTATKELFLNKLP